MGADTYYDILGVTSTAPREEIRAKYRQLVPRIHPDLDGPAALFRQVQEAYEVLSDPARRAAYDESLRAQGGAVPPPRAGHSGSGPGRPGQAWAPHGYVSNAPNRNASRKTSSSVGRHPAVTVAVAGVALVVCGVVLGQFGIGLILVGSGVLVIAGVAGLGARGARVCEAYQHSGMAAIDAMTGRQFEFLLEYFFATKGYRVARLVGRRDFGADLILDNARGRTIVQARRWTGVVRHDAVQKAVIAMAHYGASRALVVTSSNYSQHAVMVANSNGVALWDRATLAGELSVFRGEPPQSGVKRLSSDLRAGSRICLGFLATLFVAMVAGSAKARRPRSA